MLIHTDITVEPLLRVSEILNKAMTRNLVDWNAMNIATVDFNNSPSSRMVLLKKLNDQGLVFYTNFKSKKGQDLDKNKFIAVNFWWRELKQQIRIEGEVEKLSAEKSDEYFNSRPLKSRVAAIISQQGEKIDSYEILQKEIDNFGSDVELRDNFNAIDFSTSLGIEYYVNNHISLNTKFSNTLLFTPIRKHASSASLWYNQGQYNTVISFIINYYVINSQ